ncbi:MAG: hypothetical protein H0X24_10835 [Ktedonobacterales bacterium]|nr:hypothetical protein [Ktedonobacterales bacterium]
MTYYRISDEVVTRLIDVLMSAPPESERWENELRDLLDELCRLRDPVHATEPPARFMELDESALQEFATAVGEWTAWLAVERFAHDLYGQAATQVLIAVGTEPDSRIIALTVRNAAGHELNPDYDLPYWRSMLISLPAEFSQESVLWLGWQTRLQALRHTTANYDLRRPLPHPRVYRERSA